MRWSTVDAMSVRVHIDGPDVADWAGAAVRTYLAAVDGRFGAVVDLFEDRFADPAAARAVLDAYGAAASVDWDPGDVAPIDVEVITPDSVVVTAPSAAVVRNVVDLFMRLWCGQFDELAEARGAIRMSRDRVLACARFSLQAPGAWPEHPGASWSIGSDNVPAAARVAYDIWKLLGGGVADRPVLSGGSVDVRVVAVADDVD